MSVGVVDRRGILAIALACAGLTIVAFIAGLGRGFEAHLLRCLVALSSIAIATLLAIRIQAAALVLRENERRWRHIFQSVGVAIWEEDFSGVRRLFDDLARQGVSDVRRRLEDDPDLVERCISLVRIADVNEAAIRLVGAADRGQATSLRRQAFLPETLATYRELLIAPGGGPAVLCRRDRPADPRWRATVDPGRRHLACRGARPAACALSAVDITQRNRTERALAEARAELAHVSRFITLGELTASIAHEVKQPLAAIVTNGQACLRWLGRPVPELGEARACAERIVSEGNRADQVVQRLRSLARKTDPERIAVDLNTIVGEVVGLMQREVDDHRVVLRTGSARRSDAGPGRPGATARRC